MNFTVSFDLSQKVSSTLSLLLIVLLSILVAIFSLRAARDIVELGKEAPAFHLEKRSLGAEAENVEKSRTGNVEIPVSQ